MSVKPHPIALTAAMLQARACAIAYTIATIATLRGEQAPDTYIGGTFRDVAALASDLHRSAKACHKLAEALCNDPRACEAQGRIECDEWYSSSGVGGKTVVLPSPQVKAWQRFIERIDRRIAKLNESLAPFAIQAQRHGDPRGFTLALTSTDHARPLPSNGMEAGVWGVA